MTRWPTKSLGDLVSLEYGKALKAEDRSESGCYPVYGSNGIVGSHINAVIKEPTIVIGRKGAIGEAHLAENGCWPIDTAFYTRLRPPEVVSLKYLLLWFRSVNLKSLAITATIPGLNRDTLYAQKVPVPPLSEQERIACVLDEADELRKLRTQADRRTDALIPALFHGMFGDPEHTRFSVKPLIELVVEERPITYGILKPGPDIEGGIPYVRVLDIKQSRLHVEQLRKTTKEIANQYRRSMLRPGDILVTIRGTVGRTCIVPDELTGANITQDTARLVTIPSIEPVYVVEFLNTSWAQGWIIHHAQGQAVKGINLGDLKKLPVPVPPLPLQKQFASHVTDIRAMETQQAASRQRLNDLFQSLLHRAFNGELL
jgi:type I restriction enzyme, S subunit